ncbi:MAG: T9SS type A sorting domain-containing protein [Ignavibacteria bacterium]|nr:T9SS type A sorting domain-containing protein [Ignavibacteria bacterium]
MKKNKIFHKITINILAIFLLFFCISCEEPVEIISIFPMPIQDIATVTYSIGMEGNCNFQILDLQGNIVLQIFNERQYEGTYQKQFNIQHLQTGVYFLRIQFESQYYTTEKIIKQ